MDFKEFSGHLQKLQIFEIFRRNKRDRSIRKKAELATLMYQKLQLRVPHIKILFAEI